MSKPVIWIVALALLGLILGVTFRLYGQPAFLMEWTSLWGLCS